MTQQHHPEWVSLCGVGNGQRPSQPLAIGMGWVVGVQPHDHAVTPRLLRRLPPAIGPGGKLPGVLGRPPCTHANDHPGPGGRRGTLPRSGGGRGGGLFGWFRLCGWLALFRRLALWHASILGDRTHRHC